MTRINNINMTNTYSLDSFNKSMIFTITHIKSIPVFLEFLDLNIGKIGRSFILHNIKDKCGEYSTLIVEFQSLYDDSWTKNKYNDFTGLFDCLNHKIMCNLLIPQYLLKKKSTLSKGKFEYTFIVAAISDFNSIVTRNINVDHNKPSDLFINEKNIKMNYNKITNLDRIISEVRSKLILYSPKRKIMLCNDDELWGY
jgi:hypothetical protein